VETLHVGFAQPSKVVDLSTPAAARLDVSLAGQFWGLAMFSCPD